MLLGASPPRYCITSSFSATDSEDNLCSCKKASNCLYNFSSSLKLRYKNVWLPRPLKESLTKTSISLELAAHSLFRTPVTIYSFSPMRRESPKFPENPRLLSTNPSAAISFSFSGNVPSNKSLCAI